MTIVQSKSSKSFMASWHKIRCFAVGSLSSLHLFVVLVTMFFRHFSLAYTLIHPSKTCAQTIVYFVLSADSKAVKSTKGIANVVFNTQGDIIWQKAFVCYFGIHFNGLHIFTSKNSNSILNLSNVNCWVSQGSALGPTVSGMCFIISCSLLLYHISTFLSAMLLNYVQQTNIMHHPDEKQIEDVVSCSTT